MMHAMTAKHAFHILRFKNQIQLAIQAIALISIFVAPAAALALTADQHLKAATKPNFKPNHTLIPLSRWGWEMSYDTRIELAGHWGYALELGGETYPSTVAALDNSNTITGKLVALAASDPKRYPLFVLAHRPLGNQNGWDKLPETTWCHDADGRRFTNAEPWKLWSPEAPDSIFQAAATESANIIREIRKRAPIAVILNGGEDGLNYFGHSGSYWEKDPKILAAKGKRDWFDYFSDRKAHQEGIITDAIRAACPDRQVYLWYHFDGLPTWTKWQYAFDYKHMRRVSDMPDQSLYYLEFNTGWTGDRDLLTYALDSTAQALTFGDRLSYHWVCGGWIAGKLSDRERYMGFLKSLYNSGMVGAVAGYFSYPKPGFQEDLGPEVPSWLSQMMDLGQAQALFSHVEDFLREGDLLPGPDKHRIATELPAYEFPTGFPETRVLVRKHRQRSEWLITAWAADGVERKVTVEVPDLGKVEVLARPCGTVYRATAEKKAEGKVQSHLVLLDKDGMLPSAGL